MKKKLLAVSLIALGLVQGHAQYNIITAAGNGSFGYSGDGGPATSAMIAGSMAVAVDSAGNLYIADTFNYVVREVNTGGTITTIAGVGTSGFSGDGGPATAAKFNEPTGIFVDKKGNIFIDDLFNNRVREINTAGIINTIAGNGTAGFSGDGGPATAAEMHFNQGVVLDGNGNIYIADANNYRVRMVNTSGIISTIAGNGTSGYSGDGGQATAAEISNIISTFVDKSGNLYIPDANENVIRMVNTNGIISTIAGTGTAGFSGDGGPATAAMIKFPSNVAMDATGNLFISDEDNNRIRMIDLLGNISTVAGNGINGYSGDGGPATAAEMKFPLGIAITTGGDIYFCDQAPAIRELPALPTGLNYLPASAQFNIYPNPSNGKFTVTSTISGLMEVYNMLGEKVYAGSLQSSSTQIDLSDKTSGIYIYKVIKLTGEPVSTGKLVIQ